MAEDMETGAVAVEKAADAKVPTGLAEAVPEAPEAPAGRLGAVPTRMGQANKNKVQGVWINNVQLTRFPSISRRRGEALARMSRWADKA